MVSYCLLIYPSILNLWRCFLEIGMNIMESEVSVGLLLWILCCQILTLRLFDFLAGEIRERHLKRLCEISYVIIYWKCWISLRFFFCIRKSNLEGEWNRHLTFDMKATTGELIENMWSTQNYKHNKHLTQNKTMLQSEKSRVWLPMRSLNFSFYLIFPNALWPWGRLSL
jgi:hypothetical protein